MEEVELIINIFAKSFPVLVSLVLSFAGHTKSVIVDGFEAYPKRCPDFNKQKEIKFPCVDAGAGAHGVSHSVVTLAVSLTIAALLPANVTLRGSLLAMLVILLLVLYVYSISWKGELIHLEENLREKLLAKKHEWWARHVVFGITLVLLLGSLLVSFASTIYR